MKRFCIVFILCFSSLPSAWGIDAFLPQNFPSTNSIKEKIKEFQNALMGSSDDSRIHYELALAYHQDQEMDLAFQHFLTSLKLVKKADAYKICEEEKRLYEEALSDYLVLSGTDPVNAAKNLLEKYEKQASANREYLLLNFLISTAYANLGKWSEFFERFYASFPALQDSFLAYKTQGILFLRLSQRCHLPEERHHYQQQAFYHLSHALDRCSNDAGLYKILILLAKEEKNESLILTYLQKIVEAGAFIPRGDIYLYVREAIALGEKEIGQKIIDHASALYEFSRAIDAAQEYLNQH